MRVCDIINESRDTSVQAIINAAEKKAFNDASQDASSVSGDVILKYVVRELKDMHKGDVPGFLAAKRAAEEYLHKEYGK